jgi:hypothetical protein
MTMTLYAPNGLRITGTLEHLQAQARINQDSARFDCDGRLVFEYDGYTDCYWETQESLLRPKPSPAPYCRELIFLDEDGGDWFASDLTDVPPHRGDDIPIVPAAAGE